MTTSKAAITNNDEDDQQLGPCMKYLLLLTVQSTPTDCRIYSKSPRRNPPAVASFCFYIRIPVKARRCLVCSVGVPQYSSPRARRS